MSGENLLGREVMEGLSGRQGAGHHWGGMPKSIVLGVNVEDLSYLLSEGAGLNVWLLSCDLKQRTVQTVTCF